MNKVIETMEVVPVMSDGQLKSLRHQLLDSSRGRPIVRSTLVTCEGKVKALLLKDAISEHCYRPALRALKVMKFNPAKQSRRGAVRQSVLGGELVHGWMDVLRQPTDDIFRAGSRDNFFLAMRLAPMLRQFQGLMQQYLPEYYSFHMEQAMQLLRTEKTLKSLHHMRDSFQRQQLERWNVTDYYHLPGCSAFSTLTLNHNILFGAHKDGHNVQGTFGCLAALGDFVGGALGFPRLGVSFELEPRDLLIADTNDEYHGTSSGVVGDRYSVVAYLHGSLLKGNAKEIVRPAPKVRCEPGERTQNSGRGVLFSSH